LKHTNVLEKPAISKSRVSSHPPSGRKQSFIRNSGRYLQY